MRRALTNVASINPTKLVRYNNVILTIPISVAYIPTFLLHDHLKRRVLSKTSNVSKSSNANGKANKSVNRSKSLMDLENELSVLKEQLCKLQLTVNSMRNDSEKKEETIANLAKDKEKLSLDLKKEKRSNNSLKQQLQDEREFYFREKEVYCKEINECKKIKHKLKNSFKNQDATNNESKSDVHSQKNSPQKDKAVERLKESLNQTLEANYNLSIKFLRMKNTKYCLKNRLKKLQTDYEKLKYDTEEIVDRYKREIKELCERHFNEPIPPSNKMHIRVINENTALLHENLLLRLEVDRLGSEFEKHRMSDVCKETKKKLRYIRSKSTPPAIQQALPLAKEVPNNRINKDSVKQHVDKQYVTNEIDLNENRNNGNILMDSAAILVAECEMKGVNNNKNSVDDDMDMIQISENGSKSSSEISIRERIDLESNCKETILETEPSEYKTFSNS